MKQILAAATAYSVFWAVEFHSPMAYAVAVMLAFWTLDNIRRK